MEKIIEGDILKLNANSGSQSTNRSRWEEVDLQQPAAEGTSKGQRTELTSQGANISLFSGQEVNRKLTGDMISKGAVNKTATGKPGNKIFTKKLLSFKIT